MRTISGSESLPYRFSFAAPRPDSRSVHSTSSGIVVAGQSSTMPPVPHAEPSPSSTASGPCGNRGSAAAFFPAGRRDDVAGRTAGRSGAAATADAWTWVVSASDVSGTAGPVNVSGTGPGRGARAGAGRGTAGGKTTCRGPSADGRRV